MDDKNSLKIFSKRYSIVSLKMVREATALYEGRKILNAEDAVKIGKTYLTDLDREEFIVCCLDKKNQPISVSVVSIGILDSALVHPREVFKVAILSNAVSIILFHNHPSGNINPSKDDIEITSRLKDCGELIGIPVVDHIIIGDNTYRSLLGSNSGL